jgi:hypothetical protein
MKMPRALETPHEPFNSLVSSGKAGKVVDLYPRFDQT